MAGHAASANGWLRDRPDPTRRVACDAPLCRVLHAPAWPRCRNAHCSPPPLPTPAGTIGTTCWVRNDNVLSPSQTCTNQGFAPFQCKSLMDAGVAHATLEACCSYEFGSAWLGCTPSCWTPDASAKPPHRQCAQLTSPAACRAATAAAAAPAAKAAARQLHNTRDECCSATFGVAGCATYPPACYIVNPHDRQRCLRLAAGVSQCAKLMDAGTAWAARGACCARINASAAAMAACMATPTCWVAKASIGQPDRLCDQASAGGRRQQAVGSSLCPPACPHMQCAPELCQRAAVDPPTAQHAVGASTTASGGRVGGWWHAVAACHAIHVIA